VNCRPGELAMYRGEQRELHGVIVVVSYPFEWDGEWAWHVDPPFPDDGKADPHTCFDSALRPIRPGDISDEEVRDLYAPKLPEVA
jgi:hypothetical protein